MKKILRSLVITVILAACSPAPTLPPPSPADAELSRPVLGTATLGLSQEEVMEHLDAFFPTLQEGTAIDGYARRVALGTNERSILELVGDPGNLSYTLLMIAAPRSESDTLLENSAITARYLLNGFPGSTEEEMTEWMQDVFAQLAADPTSAVTRVIGERRVTFTMHTALGMISVLLAPAL